MGAKEPKGEGRNRGDNRRPAAVPLWLPPLIYVFVGFSAAALLVAHTFSGSEHPTIDTTSLGLLALLLLVPLAPYITKLRAAGIEAEIGRAELRELRLRATDLPSAPEAPDSREPTEELDVIELTARDPQLGLAKLRMDIESEVRRIYGQRVPNPARRGLSLGPMTRELVANDALPPEIAAPLQDVATLANRAIHGEYVAQEAADEITLVGVRVLEALRELEG